MQDLLKQLEATTIVDARTKTAIVPYELFHRFAAHLQQLENEIRKLQMQVSSQLRPGRDQESAAAGHEEVALAPIRD